MSAYVQVVEILQGGKKIYGIHDIQALIKKIMIPQANCG